MPIELKIPAIGESITEVQIGEWLKSEGDAVKQDEPVAVIDSEKTTFELPAPQNGRLTKILHQAGETVPVGTVVAQLDGDSHNGPPPTTPTVPQTSQSAVSQVSKPAESPAPPHPADSETGRPATVPQTSQSAVSQVSKPAKPPAPPHPADSETGDSRSSTFPSGWETGAAQKAAAKPVPEAIPSPPVAKPQPSPARKEEIVPMTLLRRTTAQRLVEAQQTMAMLTTFNEADMSAVQALRQEYQEPFEKQHQVKLGLMSFFIKAAVDALRQFPKLNAEVRGNDIIYHHYFDIGVAVATERGLVVPVLRNAERLTFAELEKAIADFTRRAREGRLKPDDLAGGTFTITNGGVFGSLLSTPIINPPQTGILGLHTIQERPVAMQGQAAIRPMMYLALTYDHRLVDGREAVLFLRRIKQAIETPARMLLEI